MPINSPTTGFGAGTTILGSGGSGTVLGTGGTILGTSGGSGGSGVGSNPFNPSGPVSTTDPSGGTGNSPSTLVIPSIGSSTNLIPLIYPPEMSVGSPSGQVGTVRIAFSFYQYQKPGINVKTKLIQTRRFIFLPIPDGIIDQYTIGYQPYDPSYMAQLIESGAPTLNNLMGVGGLPWGGLKMTGVGFTPEAEGKFKSAWENAQKQASRFGAFNRNDFKYALASSLAKLGGFFEGNASFIVDSIFKTTLNPNSTIALKAPQLRSHSFSWLLAAKSHGDSDIINKIVNEFKFNQMPDVSQQRFFLDYANLVYPEFIGTNQYLYTFKPCLITGFSALPVAAGQPSFFNETHAPTVIQMNLQLLETEMFLRGDVNINEDPNITTIAATNDLGGALSAISAVNDDLQVLPDTSSVSGNANE